MAAAAKARAAEMGQDFSSRRSILEDIGKDVQLMLLLYFPEGLAIEKVGHKFKTTFQRALIHFNSSLEEVFLTDPVYQRVRLSSSDGKTKVHGRALKAKETLPKFLARDSELLGSTSLPTSLLAGKQNAGEPKVEGEEVLVVTKPEACPRPRPRGRPRKHPLTPVAIPTMRQEIPEPTTQIESRSLENTVSASSKTTPNKNTTSSSGSTTTPDEDELPQFGGLSVRQDLFSSDSDVDSDPDSDSDDQDFDFPVISRKDARHTATHAHNCIETYAELEAERLEENQQLMDCAQ